MTRPAFFKHRWAACANIFCSAYGNHKRIEQPVRAQLCPQCGRTEYRTTSWNGWKNADALRAQTSQVERLNREAHLDLLRQGK